VTTEIATTDSKKTIGKKKRWEEFGAMVRAIRLRENMTMEEVARKAFKNPEQKSTVSDLEKGKGAISIPRALALTKVLARDEMEKKDLLVAFALHANVIAVAGLDKSAIRCILELVETLQAEAKEARKARRAARAALAASKRSETNGSNEPPIAPEVEASFATSRRYFEGPQEAGA
jgi:transcriptional regulator with XRE-family HTH domain